MGCKNRANRWAEHLWLIRSYSVALMLIDANYSLCSFWMLMWRSSSRVQRSVLLQLYTTDSSCTVDVSFEFGAGFRAEFSIQTSDVTADFSAIQDLPESYMCGGGVCLKPRRVSVLMTVRLNFYHTRLTVYPALVCDLNSLWKINALCPDLC